MPEWDEQCATLGRGLFELLQSASCSVVLSLRIDDDLGLQMNRTEHDLFVTVSTLDRNTHGLYMIAWKWLAERPLPGVERIHLRVDSVDL